jgi:hypothetical protein
LTSLHVKENYEKDESNGAMSEQLHGLVDLSFILMLLLPSHWQMATSETSTHFLPNLKDPSLLKNLGLIGGKWVGARDGKTMPVS